MKENIMYFNTNLEYQNYFITHAPFVGYIAETKELIYKKELAIPDWMYTVNEATGIPVANLMQAVWFYTFVDYLESHGTEWIDTGMKGSNLSNISYKFTFKNIIGNFAYFFTIGYYAPSGNRITNGFTTPGKTSQVTSRFGSTAGIITGSYIVQKDTPIIVNFSSDGLYYNGDKFGDWSAKETFTTDVNLHLFDAGERPMGIQMNYYTHIKSSQKQYLLPCLKGTTPIMLDLMTMTEYDNQGTGTFDTGEVVSLRDKFVEMGYCEPDFTLNTAGSVSDTYDATTRIITRNVGVVDLGTLTWTKSGTAGVYEAPINGKVNGNTNIELKNTDLVLSTSTVASGMQTGEYKGADASNKIYIKDNRYTSLDVLKNNINGVLCYYELATPYYEDARTGERIEQPSTASVEPMMLSLDDTDTTILQSEWKNSDSYDTNTEEIN